ncbi:MAG: hypothetical protein JWO19_5794 [Bryobacterales bacterium]|jgi:uncharacterized protein (TIGR03437 family)|nr:hypothetical protein [Bryobacterales bacterium]
MVYGVAIGGSQVIGIKADAMGNTYLMGYAEADFPVSFSQGSGKGTIVLKFGPTGTLIYSTRLGWASMTGGFDVDAAGAVYLGGATQRDALPTSPMSYLPLPVPDAMTAGFIAKLDSAGRAVAATYMGERVSNVLLKVNGDVLFSVVSSFGALNNSLSYLLFAGNTDIERFLDDSSSGSVRIGKDETGNVYVTGPKALRKYAPDGRLLYSRDFPSARFEQFGVTPAGLVYLFGHVPPNFPTRNATQPCAPDFPTSISGVSNGGGQILMIIGSDGETRYATYMAEQIDRFSGISGSIGDDRLYALVSAVLTPSSVHWKGVVRLNPDEIPGDHTSAACLTHGATLQVSAVTPGKIMTLFGDGLGPENGASFVLQDGRVPFELAGTRVTVDNKPVPILYAQKGQINFVTPSSLRTDGATVGVCATVHSDTSCLYAPTFSTDPGFFFTSTNVIAAINQDGTINSQEHPAKPGSYVSVYFTGGGTVDGTVIDGGIGGVELRRVTAAASASFSFKCLPDCFDLRPADAPVLFAGAVPTLVYGVDVAIVQVPSPPTTAINAQLTLHLLPPGRTVDLTASGYLYVKP